MGEICCYNCDAVITAANETEEHIILNACGGRLKSKKLLCIKCNSLFGETFDAVLAAQTNDLANMLMIQRHRGTPQPMKGILKSTGEEYRVEVGGKPFKAKPKVEILKGEENASLTIETTDEKQFRAILKGLKNKYPKLDVDFIFNEAKRERYYLTEPIRIETKMGGEMAFKSITKTAINFYIYNGGASNNIKHLLPYLHGTEAFNSVWSYYPEPSVYEPAENEVSHVLTIVGDSLNKTLYAYIELFNAQNFIILLNNEYSGEAVKFSYIYDLIGLKEIDKGIDLDISRDQLLALFRNKEMSAGHRIAKKYSRVMQIGSQRQTSLAIENITKATVTDCLKNVPKGSMVTNELLNDITQKLVEEFALFIYSKTKMAQRES